MSFSGRMERLKDAIALRDANKKEPMKFKTDSYMHIADGNFIVRADNHYTIKELHSVNGKGYKEINQFSNLGMILTRAIIRNAESILASVEDILEESIEELGKQAKESFEEEVDLINEVLRKSIKSRE
jgi:hypothetical protein